MDIRYVNFIFVSLCLLSASLLVSTSSPFILLLFVILWSYMSLAMVCAILRIRGVLREIQIENFAINESFMCVHLLFFAFYSLIFLLVLGARIFHRSVAADFDPDKNLDIFHKSVLMRDSLILV